MFTFLLALDFTISRIQVYERVGNFVILVGKMAQKG